MSIIAKRVTERYTLKTAGGDGVYRMLNAILKHLGGVAWLAKFFKGKVEDYEAEYDEDYEGIYSRWDKELFYRKGGAEELLETMFQRAIQYEGFKDWIRDAMEQTGGILTDPHIEHASLNYDGNLVLEIEVHGQDFRRYAPSDPDDDYGDYDPEDAGSYVEVPNDDTYLDDTLRDFTKWMGGERDFKRPKRRESHNFGHYDYHQYNVKISFSQPAELLVRKSFGKLVNQAAQQIEWPGIKDPPTAEAIPDKSMLTILNRRGDWPKHLKKGGKLEVLRGGDPRDLLKVRDLKTREVIYLALAKGRRGGFVLHPPKDPKTYLTVEPTR